jgi:hypothetical protein
MGNDALVCVESTNMSWGYAFSVFLILSFFEKLELIRSEEERTEGNGPSFN